MERIYIPYWNWEDWIAGMWRTLSKSEEAGHLKACIAFTGDHVVYGSAMGEVIEAWPNTMLNSLTNPLCNKRAFLGHCACQYKINCPEYITRIAWRQLTEDQRVKADDVAQRTIDRWINERKNKSIHKDMGIQMLF